MLFNLGKVHFRMGNFFHAECYLNDFLQRSNPFDTRYRTAALWLIESHIKKGDPYRAHAVAEYALKQIPDDPAFASNVSALVASIGGRP